MISNFAKNYSGFLDHYGPPKAKGARLKKGIMGGNPNINEKMGA